MEDRGNQHESGQLHETDKVDRTLGVGTSETSDQAATGKTEAKKDQSRHEMLTWSVPLIIGFYLSAFYVVRTIGFVKGDLTSALLLLQEMDFLPTLTGMIASLIPFLALPLSVGAALALIVVIRARVDTSRFSIIAVTMLMLGIVLSSWKLLLGVAGFIVLAFLSQWLIKRAPRKWYIQRVLQLLLKMDQQQVGTFALLIILLLATLGIPWTAPEKLSLTDGTRNAYVITGDGDELLVVDYQARTVDRLSESSLGKREICTPQNAAAFETLLEVFLRPADLTTCDEAGK